MLQKRIISLCDYSGIWSQPYKDAGYEVIQVDLEAFKDPQDVRLMKWNPGRVHGIIAQPPCTHFSLSGSRWWKSKGEEKLLEGLAIVDACLRFVAVYNPSWWVLENPLGRLKDYLGPPVFKFNPHEFGKLADNPDKEAYTKKTCLWGRFNPPLPILLGEETNIEPVLGSKFKNTPESENRARIRSQSPVGFSIAFFRVNP